MAHNCVLYNSMNACYVCLGLWLYNNAINPNNASFCLRRSGRAICGFCVRLTCVSFSIPSRESVLCDVLPLPVPHQKGVAVERQQRTRLQKRR